MSRNTTINFAAALLLIGAVAHFTLDGVHSANISSRSIASLKSSSLKPHYELLRRTEKLQSQIKVDLEPRTFKQIKRGDYFTLDATIESAKPFENVYYEWVLPAHVSMANGYPRTGKINGVATSNPTKVFADFRCDSDINEKIFLRVWTDSGNGQQRASAQFNTKDQEEINQKKRDLLDRQNEYLAEHPELLKIYK